MTKSAFAMLCDFDEQLNFIAANAGSLLAEYCMDAGITRRRLAELLGVSEVQLSNVINGHSLAYGLVQRFGAIAEIEGDEALPVRKREAAKP